MKFAHFSDIHIGGWREEELRRINVDAFSKSIDICIQENVAFVIIAGICLYVYIRRKNRIKRQQEALSEIRHGRKIATSIKERRSMPAEKRKRTFSASDEEIQDFKNRMLKDTRKSLENENKGWGMFK